VIKIRWSIRAVMAAMCVGFMLSGAIPAVADPKDDKARVDRQLAEASAMLEAATEKAQKAAVDYAQAVAALPDAQSALAEAQGRVVAAEVRFRRAEHDAEAAAAEQATADQRFTAAVDRVATAEGEVACFATATYRGGSFLMLDSLVDASSPNEFATRLEYLDKISDSRQRSIEQLSVARAQAREQRSIAAGAYRRAQEASAAAERALRDSRTAAAQAKQANERVEALIAQRQAAVALADSERAAVQARYAELEAESARVEAELRAAAARRRSNGGGGPSTVAPDRGAFFLMPVNAAKTSGFGRRYHPLFHVWRMHTGLDLGAGSGTPIAAAGDGEVMNAGWRSGYGNFTCLYHGETGGKGLATCYGHQSRIGVSVGQHVRRGQIIGWVGSTGNSTGPHLHFEVRVSGTPVDPEDWLPKCLC
jgi:murein DD-endopeptidase MepM/ murein hydrolase activator NlpD